MHHRESKLPTNTAQLAAQILPTCRIHLRGLTHQPLETHRFLSDLKHTLFLYPSDDSQELTPEIASRFGPDLTLIVPDGSWRQASKVAKREESLNQIPHVHLTSDFPTQYHLRREPKEGGLATFEAIARALGVIEGPEVRLKLEAIFKQFVERTLKSRGIPQKHFTW